MAYKILLGVPSSGIISEGTAKASWLPSLKHQVVRIPSCEAGPNFNAIWVGALNAGMKGEYTHLSMIHADLTVLEKEEGLRWLDILAQEMDGVDADFISTPIAIKDARCLTSCGIGDPKNPWCPWRRFTIKELGKLPVTFNAQMAGYPEKYLLHNNGLCLWDLRKELWYDTLGPEKRCRCTFNFREEIRLVDGAWTRFVESEDWAYSRDLWRMGARTYLTRRVQVLHHGSMTFSNQGEEGLYQEGDEDTASNWRGDHDQANQPGVQSNLGGREKPQQAQSQQG